MKNEKRKTKKNRCLIGKVEWLEGESSKQQTANSKQQGKKCTAMRTGNTWVVPLSLTARLLATQLASETLKPGILLPPHLLKSYVGNESTVSYVNKFSQTNPFQRKHKLQAFSTSFFRQQDDPFALVIPASQLIPLLDPPPSEIDQVIIPPNGSDVLILNPHFGQVENYVEKLRSQYLGNIDSVAFPRIRIWSINSTHLLSNASGWSVEHVAIGELKISPVSLLSNDPQANDSMETLIEESPIIQQLLNTHLLLPQLQHKEQTDIYLAEQMIIESALSLMSHPEYAQNYKKLKYSETRPNPEIEFSSTETMALKQMILRIVDESVKVIRASHIVQNALKKSPVFNAVLSKERMFNTVLNIIYNDESISHLMATMDPQKETLKRRKILDEIDSRELQLDEDNIEENADMFELRTDHANKYQRTLHLRHPASANSFIVKEGQQLGIKTTMNSMVCNMFSVDELRKLSEKEEKSEFISLSHLQSQNSSAA